MNSVPPLHKVPRFPQLVPHVAPGQRKHICAHKRIPAGWQAILERARAPLSAPSRFHTMLRSCFLVTPGLELCTQALGTPDQGVCRDNGLHRHLYDQAPVVHDLLFLNSNLALAFLDSLTTKGTWVIMLRCFALP